MFTNCRRDYNIKYFISVPPFPSLLAGGYWLCLSKNYEQSDTCQSWAEAMTRLCSTPVSCLTLMWRVHVPDGTAMSWCSFCHPISLSADNAHADLQRHLTWEKISLVWLSPWQVDIVYYYNKPNKYMNTLIIQH